MKSRPKVFISYSHESEEHLERVLQLAWALQRDGIAVALDRFLLRPSEGWPTWCERQLKPDVNDRVLIVSTKNYWKRVDAEVPSDEGRGAFWEGRIIKSYIYREKDRDDCRYIPVAFGKVEREWLPHYLEIDSVILLEDGQLVTTRDSGYQKLYRCLTDQFPVAQYPVGELVNLPVKLPDVGNQSDQGRATRGEVMWKETAEVTVKEGPPTNVMKKAKILSPSPSSHNTGTIIIADVAEFSDKFDDRNRAAIFGAVWGFIHNHEMLKSRSERVYCDNTLDGAVVCFDGTLHKDAVSFAKEWIVHVASNLPELGVQLRVGISTGVFLLEPRNGGRKQAPKGLVSTHLIPFGSAVKEVARLANIAGVDKVEGKGFVVMDESFIRKIETHDSEYFEEELAPCLYPEISQEACAKQAKSFRGVQSFRVLNIYEKTPLIPSGVREIKFLGKMIQDTMRGMAARLWQYLYSKSLETYEDMALNKRAMERLKTQNKLRISLFCQDPRRTARKLVCTNFRLLDWHHKADEMELAQPFTAYPLGVASGRGPAGTAFETGRCQFLNNLPEVHLRDGKPTPSSLASYLDALNKHGCGVSEEVARGMKRYARTYICVPMGILPEHPTLVACVDLTGGLPWMSPEDGLALASNLQDEFSGQLGVLMDKRS